MEELKQFSNLEVTQSLLKWNDQSKEWKMESGKITKIVEYVKETLSKFVILPKEQIHDMLTKIDDLQIVAKTSFDEIKNIRSMIKASVKEIEDYIQSSSITNLDETFAKEMIVFQSLEREHTIQKCLKQKEIFSDIYLDTGFHTSMLTNLQSRLECLKTNISEITRKSSFKKNSCKETENKKTPKSNTKSSEVVEETKTIFEIENNNGNSDNKISKVDSREMEQNNNILKIIDDLDIHGQSSNSQALRTSDFSNSNYNSTTIERMQVNKHNESKNKVLPEVYKNEREIQNLFENKEPLEMKVRLKRPKKSKLNSTLMEGSNTNYDPSECPKTIDGARTIVVKLKNKITPNILIKNPKDDLKNTPEKSQVNEPLKMQDTTLSHNLTKCNQITEEISHINEKIKLYGNKNVFDDQRNVKRVLNIDTKKDVFKNDERKGATETKKGLEKSKITVKRKTKYKILQDESRNIGEIPFEQKKKEPLKIQEKPIQTTKFQYMTSTKDSTKSSKTIEEKCKTVDKHIMQECKGVLNSASKDETTNTPGVQTVNKNEKYKFREDQLTRPIIVQEEEFNERSSKIANENMKTVEEGKLREKTKVICKVKHRNNLVNKKICNEIENQEIDVGLESKKKNLRMSSTNDDIITNIELLNNAKEKYSSSEVKRNNTVNDKIKAWGSDTRIAEPTLFVKESLNILDSSDSSIRIKNRSSNKIQTRTKPIAISLETLIESKSNNDEKEYDEIKSAKKILNAKPISVEELRCLKKMSSKKSMHLKKLKLIKRQRRTVKRKKFSKADFFLKHQRFKEKIKNLTLRHESENSQIHLEGSLRIQKSEHSCNSSELTKNNQSKSSTSDHRGTNEINTNGNLVSETRRSSNNHAVEYSSLLNEASSQKFIDCDGQTTYENQNTRVPIKNLTTGNSDIDSIDILESPLNEQSDSNKVNEKEIHQNQNDRKTSQSACLESDLEFVKEICSKNNYCCIKGDKDVNESQIVNDAGDLMPAKKSTIRRNMSKSFLKIEIKNENENSMSKANINPIGEDSNAVVCSSMKAIEINKVSNLTEKPLNENINSCRKKEPITKNKEKTVENKSKLKLTKNPLYRKSSAKVEQMQDNIDKRKKNKIDQKDKNKIGIRKECIAFGTNRVVKRPRNAYNAKKNLNLTKERNKMITEAGKYQQKKLNNNTNLKSKEVLKKEPFKAAETILKKDENEDLLTKLNCDNFPETVPENGFRRSRSLKIVKKTKEIIDEFNECNDKIKKESEKQNKQDKCINNILNNNNRFKVLPYGKPYERRKSANPHREADNENNFIENANEIKFTNIELHKKIESENLVEVQNPKKLFSPKPNQSREKNVKTKTEALCDQEKCDDRKNDIKIKINLETGFDDGEKIAIENQQMQVLETSKELEMNDVEKLEMNDLERFEMDDAENLNTKEQNDEDSFITDGKNQCYKNIKLKENYNVEKITTIKTDSYNVGKLNETINAGIIKNNSIHICNDVNLKHFTEKTDNNSILKISENVCCRKKIIMATKDKQNEIDKIAPINGDARNDFKSKVALKNEFEKKTNIITDKESDLIHDRNSTIVNKPIFMKKECNQTKRNCYQTKKDFNQTKYDCIKTKNDCIQTKNDCIQAKNDCIQTKNDGYQRYDFENMNLPMDITTVKEDNLDLCADIIDINSIESSLNSGFCPTKLGVIDKTCDVKAEKTMNCKETPVVSDLVKPEIENNIKMTNHDNMHFSIEFSDHKMIGNEDYCFSNKDTKIKIDTRISTNFDVNNIPRNDRRLMDGISRFNRDKTNNPARNPIDAISIRVTSGNSCDLKRDFVDIRKKSNVDDEDDTLMFSKEDTCESLENNYLLLEKLDKVEDMRITSDEDLHFRLEPPRGNNLNENSEMICHKPRGFSFHNQQKMVCNSGDVGILEIEQMDNNRLLKQQYSKENNVYYTNDQKDQLMEVFQQQKDETQKLLKRGNSWLKKEPLRELKLEHDIWLRALQKERTILKIESSKDKIIPKEYSQSDQDVVEIENSETKTKERSMKQLERLKRFEDDRKSFKAMCVNRVRRRKEIRILNQAIYTQKGKEDYNDRYPKAIIVEKEGNNEIKDEADTSDDVDDNMDEISLKIPNVRELKEKTLNHFGIINCLSNIRSNIFKLINKNNSNKNISKSSDMSISEISNFEYIMDDEKVKQNKKNAPITKGNSDSILESEKLKTVGKKNSVLNKGKPISSKDPNKKTGCCRKANATSAENGVVEKRISNVKSLELSLEDDKDSIMGSEMGSFQNLASSESIEDGNLDSISRVPSIAQKSKEVELDNIVDDMGSKDPKKKRMEKPKFNYYEDDMNIQKLACENSDGVNSLTKTKTDETVLDEVCTADITDDDFPINKDDINNPKFWPTYVYRIPQENSSKRSIACILKAKVGCIGKQSNIECIELSTERKLPSIDLREDVAGTAFELRSVANQSEFDFDTPWKMLIPHVLLKSSPKDLVILTLNEDGTTWLELPTTESANEDYKEYKSRFVETRLEKPFGIFIVQTKTKTEAGIITKHGARIISSIDSRVFISVPADAIRITLNTNLKINQVDNTFWKELKSKSDKTVLDQVICSSHLIDFFSKKKKLIKPANISCFLPLNPEIKKQMEDQAKVVVPIKRKYSADDDDDDIISELSVNSGDLKADLNPFQKSLLMTGITGANANENIQVVCNSVEEDKWFPIENVQLSVDKTKEQISMELATMQSIKFLMVRANRNITVENLAKSMRMIENELSVRNSQIILMKSATHAHDFVLAVCLRSRFERCTSQLIDDGFQMEHINSPISVELSERQIITALFSGNICNRKPERNILRFTYQSLFQIMYKFRVTEIDSYAQRAIDHYRGYLQIFLRKLVKKPIEVADPKTRKGPIQYHWVEEDVSVGKLLISLPKRKLVHFKYFRDTIFNRDLLDNYIILFATIAEGVRGSWKDLGTALNISESRMQSIRHHNNAHQIERMAVQMLIFWLKGLEMNENKQDKLIKALNDMNRKDLGNLLKKAMEDEDASFTESII